jgi:hypothetical protein
METVCIRVANLRKLGYDSLEEWLQDPSHIYIGRNMTAYVKGAKKSKWANPFPVKQYSREECLQMYEKYIRNSDLYNQLEELRGKKLGCWCKPEPCHGDVLIKLSSEKIDRDQM